MTRGDAEIGLEALIELTYESQNTSQEENVDGDQYRFKDIWKFLGRESSHSPGLTACVFEVLLRYIIRVRRSELHRDHFSFPRQETIIKHRTETHGEVITDRSWEQDGLLADVTHHPSYGGHIQRPDIDASDRNLASGRFVEPLQ
jgi:hypothetical protein